MRHVVLINNSYLENLPVRHLGAYLRRAGFRVTTIHCEGKKDSIFKPLSEKSLTALAEYCRDCDLVGLSLLTTHQLKRAVQIDDHLKANITAKVLWGGVPVICDPAFYLQYADYICMGEGELVAEQLLNDAPPEDIAGLGYKDEHGRLVMNPIPALLDVNALPLPHLDVQGGYILRNGELIPLKNELTRLVRYSILSVRGCPYSCSYCLNSRLKTVFSGKGPYLRFVDTARVIEELTWAKEHLPRLREVIFDDDDFFLRPEKDLKKLLDAYAAGIALPIYFIQSHIRHITASKVRLLLESGIPLKHFHIGLQSGSSRTNTALFKREFKKASFIDTVGMLVKKGFRLTLHVISDNPYEEARDKYDALLFLHDLAREIRARATIDVPVEIYDHKLMFYPGAKLYDQAMKDGVISSDYMDEVLLKRSTMRNREEDLDNDACVIGLFNTAVGKGFAAWLAYRCIKLLRVKPLFKVMAKYALLPKGYLFLKKIKVPAHTGR